MATYQQEYPEFCKELDRVRRYDRSLTVLVVKLDEEQLFEIREGLLRHVTASVEKEKSESVVTCAVQVMFANVGYLLQDLLRDMDTATCDVSRSRYVVLLPELTRAEAEGTAARLEETILRVAGVRVRIGMAEFRTDGVLIEDLVNEASDKSDRGGVESGSTVTLNPATNGKTTLPVQG
jgi:hypothetical protein